MLTAPGGFVCYTAELPWRDNARKRSCIPPGEYPCAIVKSPRFGRVYGLQGVPGRSHVLIHRGNFAGDVSRGFVSHVEGCILLGRKIGRLATPGGLQNAVLASAPAVSAFIDHMGGEPFTLVIEGIQDA